MSSVQTWFSRPASSWLGRTSQSAVWPLTAAFAIPLVLGATIFVAIAYLALVNTDVSAVKIAIGKQIEILNSDAYPNPNEISREADLPPPDRAFDNLVQGLRADQRDDRAKNLDQTDFFLFGPDPSGRQGAELSDPIAHPCPAWSWRGIGNPCFGLGDTAQGEVWYLLHDRDPQRRGAIWGFAKRISVPGTGAPKYLFVGHKLGMGALEGQLLSLLAATLGVSAFVALVIGLLVSQLMLRRVDAVNAVCDQVRHGELSARSDGASANDEFGELSRHINNMLDQISALVHGLRDVSNRIAHDLRTPIGRLKANIEAVAAADNLREAQERADAAVAETETILDTFQALLDIAEVEAGADGGLQFVQLDAAARSAIDMYEAVADDAQVRLLSRLEPARILGEPSLLVRLIANLIDNAIKFSPQGSDVMVAVERRGNAFVLEIRDHGRGIPPEEMEQVKRRHVRGSGSGQTMGHGLGLALVVAVAKRHGAELTMDDAQPGLIVRVTFRDIHAPASPV